MSKAILGKKLGMTQVFTEEGAVVPVTVVEASPNVVVRVKTVDTDGYNSIQLGYGEIKEKHLTKPVKGQFDKAGVAPVKYLREFRLTDTPEYTSLLGLYRIWLRRASAFCCSVGSMDSGSTSMVAAVWVIMESNRV